MPSLNTLRCLTKERFRSLPQPLNVIAIIIIIIIMGNRKKKKSVGGH